MITFEHVFKSYQDKQVALSDLSFQLDKGTFTFLQGHSGAGKSTLLKLLRREVLPTEGTITVNGYCLNSLTKNKVPELRRSVSMIFQNPMLLKQKTLFDNVALPLVIEGLHYQDLARRVRAALAKVGLEGKENRLPATLSAGEQQRAGVARALVNRPALLLADEPTGNLDPKLSAEIMNLFDQFNQLGVTVLIATHDHYLIQEMGHPVLTLDQGKLISDPDLRGERL